MRRLLQLVLLSALGYSQQSFPRFEDYPTSKDFTGKPAAPKLVRPADRQFRTVIRDGAAKGPNFAGHYTIVSWGCGSGCVSMTIVDARDGTVFQAPFRVLEWGMPLMKYEGRYAANEEHFEPLSFGLGSRLLIVRGCPEEKNCASYFYEWQTPHFEMIRKVQAKEAPAAPVHAF